MNTDRVESCCQGGEGEANEYYHHPTCKWYSKIESFDKGYIGTEITPEMEESAVLHFHLSTGWSYTQKEETNAYLEFTHGARWQRYHDKKKQQHFLDLIFIKCQRLIWEELTYTPTSAKEIATKLRKETKHISSQLRQMSKTGLVKFTREGKLKSWYRDKSHLI